MLYFEMMEYEMVDKISRHNRIYKKFAKYSKKNNIDKLKGLEMGDENGDYGDVEEL